MTQRPIVRAALRILRPLWRVRRLSLWTERLFWSRWLSKRPDVVAEALSPSRPFPDDLAALVQQMGRDSVDVLEVGAGPYGSIGRAHPNLSVRITPTDILAPEYDRMLARRGIDPPHRTIFADAEKLVAQFGADSFDLVYATNCVDHMERPVTAVAEMVSVVREGGFVVLCHELNEGLRQDYAGLHQWNLDAQDGMFVIWNEQERRDVTALLADACDVTVDVREGLLHTTIRKKRPGRVAASAPSKS